MPTIEKRSAFEARSEKSLIQWPSEEEILEVSTRLAAITRMGARSEARGDYFISGDLAYQIHEIIRATAELFRKTKRLEP